MGQDDYGGIFQSAFQEAGGGSPYDLDQHARKADADMNQFRRDLEAFHAEMQRKARSPAPAVAAAAGHGAGGRRTGAVRLPAAIGRDAVGAVVSRRRSDSKT